jgi:pimeloyl-ACP methyl ester carboxylesterase
MELVDRIAAQRLRRLGFWSVRVPGPVGTHQLYDGPGGGALPTLVLLHGFSSRATHLVKLVPLLRGHFRRLVMPDLLGHGLSDEPTPLATNHDISEAFFDMLDEVLDEPAVVFGNSLGGMFALRYASRRPQQVAGLLVTSPGGAPLPPDQHAAFLKRFRPQTLAEARDLVDRAFAVSPRLADLAARNLHKRMSAPTVQRLLDQMTHDDLLHPDELAAVRAPTCLLWGERERILLPEHLAFFQAHLPAHARIERPAGYGHVPYFENAADLAARIIAFAQQIDHRAAA